VLGDVRLDELPRGFQRVVMGLVFKKGSQQWPLGHRVVREYGDERGHRSGRFPEKFVEQADHFASFGIVQLKLFPDQDQPEGIDDAHVHCPVEVDWFALKMGLIMLNQACD